MIGKTHLTDMGIEIKISSKGQVVIPKEMRDALGLGVGSPLHISRIGRQIVLEAPESIPARPKITYEEFRRRVPRYEGPPATIEQMRSAVDEMFAKRGRP